MKTSPFYSYHFSIYSNNPAVRFTVVLSGNFISIAIKRLFSNLSPDPLPLIREGGMIFEGAVTPSNYPQQATYIV